MESRNAKQTNTPEQRPVIQADQTVKQATPILIDKKDLVNSLKSEKQLQIEEAIANTKPDIIYPTKSNYEKWLDVTIAPETRNMVQFDPLFRASSVGGAGVVGGLAIKGFTVTAAADAVTVAPKVTETAWKLFQASQTPIGQIGIGVGLEVVSKYAEEDLPPDIPYSSPFMEISSNATQIFINTFIHVMNQNEINKNDTIRKSINVSEEYLKQK